MAKRSKSKRVTSDGGGSFSSTPKRSRSSGFKYAVRGSNGRFITADDKRKELESIDRIKSTFGVRDKSDINRILYSPEFKRVTFTSEYTESALDFSQNLEGVMARSPQRVVIITTEGERMEFEGKDYESIKAVINQEVSSLWRVATLLEEDAMKDDEKRYKQRMREWKKAGQKGSPPRQKKRSTFIPEYKLVMEEYSSGKIKNIEYNFSDNNLNPQSGIDRSQWNQNLTKF